MHEDEKNENGLVEKSKGFLPVIGIGITAVILLAVGIAGNIKTHVPIETTTLGVTQGVEQKVTNVPDERTTVWKVEPTTKYKYEDMIIVTEPASETTTQRPAPTSYSLPLGTNIGDDYSQGIPVYSEIMGDWRTHNGVDFNAAYGDGVRAIAKGIVKDVYYDSLMGDTIVIDHGGGVVAKYCGVTADEKIIKGIIVEECDKLGELSEIPAEANAEYPHLHLEITVDGEIKDPLEVMNLY